MTRLFLALAILGALCACRQPLRGDVVLGTGHEARSLLGEALDPPPVAPEREAELTANLDAARAAWQADPTSEDATIWLGRRLAYLGRYREAIGVYTRGLEEHPASSRLRRHRGHRFITVRRLDDAIVDLSRAAELAAGEPDTIEPDTIEPDGAPNAAGIPTSTRQSNIAYHLGLAQFLKGDFEAALASYRRCAELSTTDDMRCATAHWLYMTLRRLGLDEEAREVLAPIAEDMQILENHGYHACLLLYKGLRTPEEVLAAAEGEIDFASRGFGVGHWHLVEGRPDEAFRIFRRILAGDVWMAFGYLGAEAELARSRE